MKHFFVDQSLRYDLGRKAFNTDISDLVQEILDKVEELSCDAYSELAKGRIHISDDPTPKEGFEPLNEQWSEHSHDNFRDILLDRIADAIGQRKTIRENERTDSEPCEIELIDF